MPLNYPEPKVGLKVVFDSRTVLIGESQQAKDMRSFAIAAGAVDDTVLLTGETGAGKDHLAEIIHESGARGSKNARFVTVDCGSMSDTLWESEMFGHTQGAFTDARMSKKGLIEIAQNGTIFFDEVGNMPPVLQAKLLRIVEKKSYRPLGDTSEKPINVRVVLATNLNLKKAVAKGLFRSDLFHRINVLSYKIPPLRERIEDVPLLADFYLHQRGSNKRLSSGAVSALLAYDWPGNVRELRNVMVRADFDSGVEAEILPRHIVPHLECVGSVVHFDLGEFATHEEVEKSYFIECLKRSHGNFKEGAKLAGLTLRIFRYTIEKLGLLSMIDKFKREEE